MVDVDVGEFRFSSNFDSGNLAKVSLQDPHTAASVPRGAAVSKPSQYFLWVASDCEGSIHDTGIRTWFFFTITPTNTKQQRPRYCRFTIVNLSPRIRIFDHDNRAVVKVGSGAWQRLGKPMEIELVQPGSASSPITDASEIIAMTTSRKNSGITDETVMRVSWTFAPSSESASFALCYPYSYRHHLSEIDRWQATAGERCTFARETLALSTGGRLVELLTITGLHGAAEPEPFYSQHAPLRTSNPRPPLFPHKRYVLLTARVHPGETPASYMLQGFVDFVLSDDDRAKMLRDHFVFKVVPMINPDGVVLGHYRTDSNGVNLNRCYDRPSAEYHPAICGIRDMFHELSKTVLLHLYVDLHAHAALRGCFMFGNAWEREAEQVETLLFPKLLGFHCPLFDFAACDFTSKSMTATSRSDTESKGGTGRVALGVETHLLHSYTLEASYNGRIGKPGHFDVAKYEGIGRSIAVSILSYNQLGAAKALAQSPFRDLPGLREYLATALHRFREYAATIPPDASTRKKDCDAFLAKLALPAVNAAA
jgi:hypothetical protein